MKNKEKKYACIGLCPVCSQGRQIITRENRTGKLYVLCEECESEWRLPQDASDMEKASSGVFAESTLLTREELAEHPWSAYLEGAI